MRKPKPKCTALALVPRAPLAVIPESAESLATVERARGGALGGAVAVKALAQTACAFEAQADGDPLPIWTFHVDHLCGDCKRWWWSEKRLRA